MPRKSSKKPGGGSGTPDSDQTFIGTSAADRLSGGSGNDRLFGGGGDDKIDGRDGSDTAIYDGSINDYDLRLGHRGIWYVTDLNPADGDEGRDELKNIETLQFSDYSYNLNGDNPTVIVAEADVIYAFAGEDVSFSLTAYDVDDPTWIELFDRNGSYDHLTVNQPYWAVQTLGERGRKIDANVTITQNGTADALGYSDYTRGYLAKDETETITYTFRAGSNTAGWTYESVDVVYIGLNDDPTLAALPGLSVTEDGGPEITDLSGFAEDIDSDDDATTLTYSVVSAPALLDVSFDGTVLRVDPGAKFQILSADEFVDFTIQVQATDRHGAKTEIRDIAVRVQGTDDPITLYATPDGKVDYGALGLDPFATASLGPLNALFDNPDYLALFAFTQNDDTLVLNATDMVSFQSDTFFFESVGTVNYSALPIVTGGGDDTLLIALSGEGSEFQFNDITTGAGRDVVSIDVQTAYGIESFANSIHTGAQDDQVFINIDTPGIIQFASNLVSTGTGNDLVHVEVRSTRADGPSGLSPFAGNDFNLGSGNDRLIIDLELPNTIDGGITGNITAGDGDDVIEISNAGSSLSDQAYSLFRTLGLYGQINLGEGNDTFIFDVTAFDSEGASARINGGAYDGHDDGGHDTVMLMTGNIADFDVTRTSSDSWVITQGGQTLLLYDIEEIVALDGSISDLFG